MNYQVGNICYASIEDAENAYFSNVVPTISADGELHQVMFKNNQWTYKNQPIKAYLPTCSIEQNVKDGVELGFYCMATIVALWSIKLISRMLFRFV